jgi:hypothetical protein
MSDVFDTASANKLVSRELSVKRPDALSVGSRGRFCYVISWQLFQLKGEAADESITRPSLPTSRNDSPSAVITPLLSYL